MINPSNEYRVYFPSDLMCQNIDGKMKLMLGTSGELTDNFMIVGIGRFTEDQKLLDICEEKLLIDKRKTK